MERVTNGWDVYALGYIKFAKQGNEVAKGLALKVSWRGFYITHKFYI